MNNYKITMENIRGDEIRDKPYGEGTISNPYKISSAENLVYFAEHEELWTDTYFLQTNNIDMDGINWVYSIILNNCNYNGNEYYIKNLDIVINENVYPYSSGLFSECKRTILSNININNSSFLNNTGTRDYFDVGMIVGNLKVYSEVINCSVNNCIIDNRQTNWSTGGIVGASSLSKISYCISSGNIIYGYALTGGVIGYSFWYVDVFNCKTINNTIYSINCSGTFSIGGVVGYNHSYCVVSNSYSINNEIIINSIYTINTIQAGGVSGTVTEDAFSFQNWSNSKIINNATATNEYIGGVNGVNWSESSLSNTSYWDYQTSGIGDSDYQNPSGIKANKITTAQLAQQSTFTGWDFTDIWEMGTQYPKLRFESFIMEKETEVFEYPFPYHILKNTTKYDPFSYISYDYMVSSSRKASFEAYIEDYFDTETFDFINSLTRVGYGSYDNDITLYNHFYYSTEDDEDEFVRIELEDNTIKYNVGSTVTDKYGEVRTVSSREIVSEGISTIMCRIYQITDNGERIVYSGLIDKRETKFDGKKLKIGLIDMMGLYVELAKKYTKTINDISDSGFDMIDTASSIKQFVSFLKENIDINNAYLPDIDKIAPNINEDESIDYNYNEYFSERNNTMREFFVVETPYSNDINASFHLFLDASVDSQTGELSLAVRNLSSISSNYDISFNLSNATNISTMFFNPSGLKLTLPRYPTNYYFKSYTMDFRRKNYPIVFNLFCQYINGKICVYVNFAMLSDAKEIPYYNSPQKIAFLSPYFDTRENEIYTKYLLIEDSISPLDYGVTLSNYSNLYNYVIDIIGNNIDEINTKIELFTNDFNNMLNGNLAFLAISDTQDYVFDETGDNKIVSIFEEIDDEYKYLMKVETSKRLNNGVTFSDDQFSSTYNVYKQNLTKLDIPLVYNNTYREILPLYTGSSSLYDITKLFSLTCYNKILTKDTGEMYFDKESYSNTNGYVDIDKAEIINSYSQESMIGDDEEFNILDNIYIGTKYIKEAYKRLETSTKETYKKLYENNNMKIGFNLANYNYDIKNVNGTIIANRELQHKDVLRIYNGSRQIIHVFLTSVKFINNDTELELEGITQETRNITLYSADEYKTISR